MVSPPDQEDLAVGRRRVFVHLRPALDLVDYRWRFDNGRYSDQTPYGFHHAEDHGHTVEFSAPLVLGRVGTRLARVLRGLLKFELVHAFQNRAAIRRADVVWTMTENEALGVSALMAVRLVARRPVIGSTVWMINEWHSYSALRQRLYRWLTRRMSVVLVHTRPALERARAVLPRADTRLLTFGVAAETYLRERPEPADEDVISIVGLGNDRTRDWDLLLRAFGNDPRFRLTIVCSWFDTGATEGYDNVAVQTVIGMENFVRLYQDATYVAIPMRPNIYSGITVALEAAALGVPVISTATGGVDTYFSADEMIFVAVDDDDGWRRAALEHDQEARKAMAKRARERFEAGDYSTAGMVEQYHRITESLL